MEDIKPNVQLSAGSCEALQTAPHSDDPIYESPHTLQFLSVKRVSNSTSAPGPNERYRIILSDGIHFIQAMLATQLNPLVADGQLQKHTVAVIEKATCNNVQNKKCA